MLDSGATFLQIREKDLEPGRFAQEAEELRQLCQRRNVPFVVNDSVEIALSCGYESQQAFTAAFKEMYKLPPARYRAQGVFYPLQLPLCLEEQGRLTEKERFCQLSSGKRTGGSEK